MKVVQLLAMSLFTLVTGVFWGTWFGLSRSITTLTPATFLEVGHTMIANLRGPMRILIPVTIAVMATLVVAHHRRRERTAFGLAAAALVLLIAATAITLAVNVPIDGLIAAWTQATLPSDWQSIRDRWELYHGLRTALALVGAACLFASVLSARGRDGKESPHA